MSVKKHKKSLEKLKQKDPAFYEFLEKEDKEILEFANEESENGNTV